MTFTSSAAASWGCHTHRVDLIDAGKFNSMFLLGPGPLVIRDHAGE
jgi:hypothetical protein